MKSRIHKERLDLTTNGSGAASGYTEAITGRLYAIETIVGTFASGVDIVVTCENEASGAIMTKANFNADGIYYPRAATCAVADGTGLTNYDLPVLAGRVLVTIAQGGDTLSGSVIIFWKD
jgi:hypothetical protein